MAFFGLLTPIHLPGYFHHGLGIRGTHVFCQSFLLMIKKGMDTADCTWTGKPRRAKVKERRGGGENSRGKSKGREGAEKKTAEVHGYQSLTYNSYINSLYSPLGTFGKRTFLAEPQRTITAIRRKGDDREESQTHQRQPRQEEEGCSGCHFTATGEVIP